jgi:endonuclease/exonuclease/phosphatase family metal-dependent hydrolase
MPTTIRLVQYNVRRLVADSGVSMLGSVAATLRALRPSIVTLNELDIQASPGCVEALAEAAGLEHHAFFGHALGGRYGNAILSSFALRDPLFLHLDGGSMVKWSADKPAKRIARGALICTFDIGGGQDGQSGKGGDGSEGSEGGEGRCPPISLVCTHLDHIAEAERRVQIDHILRVVGERADERKTSCIEGAVGGSVGGALGAPVGGPGPVLVAGDLNALKRRDYPSSAWKELEATNSRNGWAPPSDSEGSPGGCIHQLEVGNGFTDLFARAHRPSDGRGSGALDGGKCEGEGGGGVRGGRSGGDGGGDGVSSVRDLDPQRKWTAHVEDPKYRIDYVFGNRTLLEHFDVTGGAVDGGAAGSDHFPLVIDLMLSDMYRSTPLGSQSERTTVATRAVDSQSSDAKL